MFLAKNTKAISVEKTNPIAIVLGRTEYAKQLTLLLEEKGVQVVTLTEPFLLSREKNICYIFSLSESDADNIVLCKIGKKLYNIDNMIAICNDRINERMFISENIQYMLNEGVTAYSLYKAIQRDMEVRL